MFFCNNLPKPKFGFWSPCDPTTSCNQNRIHSICTSSCSWEFKCECTLADLLQFCSIFALLTPCVLLDPPIAFVLHAQDACILWIPKLRVTHNCHVITVMLDRLWMLIHALHLHLWQWNSLHILKKFVVVLLCVLQVNGNDGNECWNEDGTYCVTMMEKTTLQRWSGRTHEVDNLLALWIDS